MLDKYRVVCSENQQLYPNRVFIDIYPADSDLNHDCLLQLRKMKNPDVAQIVSDIILTDLGNEKVHLQYEEVSDSAFLARQNELRKTLDEDIRQAFVQMRRENKDRTIEANINSMAVIYGLSEPIDENAPISAREYELRKTLEREKRIYQKKREMAEYKENQASSTETRLAWRTILNRYRGD